MTEWEDVAVNRARPLPGVRRVVLEIVAASLVLGGVAGVLWWQLSPDVLGVVSENGVALDAVRGSAEFDREANYVMLTAGAGLLLSVVFSVRYRRRPVSALLSVAICGVAGALVALGVGHLLGPGSVDQRAARADVGDSLNLPFELHAYAALIAWPLVAAIMMAIIAAFRDDQTSWGGHHRELPTLDLDHV